MNIDVCEVTKRYASHAAAIDGVSLTIRQGSFWTIVGPTGSGKTTLLRLIAGLTPPDAGRVLLNSQPVLQIPPFRRSIAYLPQGNGLLPQWTVRQNLLKPLRWRRLSSTEVARKVAEMAAACDIEDLLDRYPHELSGGQRQRAALAQVLIQPVDCLLLDEPFKHLDIVARDPFIELLHAHRQSTGQTIVCVTHDREEVARQKENYVAVLREGRLVQAGTRAELAASPADPFVFSLTSPFGIELFTGTLCTTPDGGLFSCGDGRTRAVVPLHFLSRTSTAETAITMVVPRHRFFLFPNAGEHVAREGVSFGIGHVVCAEENNGVLRVQFDIGNHHCTMCRETEAVPELVRRLRPGNTVSVVATDVRFFPACGTNINRA